VPQAVAVRGRSAASPISAGPLIGLAMVALFAVVADVALGTGAWFFVITGLMLVTLVVTRPEIGIVLFLSTFLVTYPQALQGSGFLTINNMLGLLFLVLLAYRIRARGDWWFLRNREMQLLLFIAVCYAVSEMFNGPESRLAELIGPSERNIAARLYLNRVAFVLFFATFIRTPAQMRLVYLLVIAMMVMSALSGLQGGLTSAGLYGSRASSVVQGGIAQAGNPNRVAMYAIICIGALWYLRRQVRGRVGQISLLGLIVLLAVTVMMTASRSGMLGLFTCVAFIVIEEGVSLRRMLTLGLVGVVTTVLVLQVVPEKNLERLGNLPGSAASAGTVGTGSLERRAYAFEIGYEIARENLLLGVGAGNWEIVRFMRDPARSTAPPHSSVLLAMAEGGIFCLLSFVALFWYTFQNLSVAQQLLPPARRVRDLNWIVSGARTGVIAIAVFSVVADLWQSIVLFWLIGLGIVVRRYAEARSRAMS
jgi:hypothetical protein